MANTDDGGIQLAAYGPVTVQKLTQGGSPQGDPSELVPKADLDAAVSRIEELEASLTKFDKLESELKRVEGVLGGLGVKFDEADGSMQDLTAATDTFKEAIGDMIETGFKEQDATFVTKADARGTYATDATVKQQFTQLGKRLSEIQELVEKNAGEKLPRCPDPNDPDNGFVEHQSKNPGNDHPDVPFVPGVTIHYGCDSGYGIKGAVAGETNIKAYERVCYADGTWASVADKDKFVGPATCEKCQAARYNKIDVTKYYRQTQGARWGRDFRSGNPGETNYWFVGPISAAGFTEMKFEWEYVTGYSWNCGQSKKTGFIDCDKEGQDPSRGRYKNGPYMNVYIQDANDPENQVKVYSSGMLKHYPYDNCGANGGWGDVATKNDGCYSPAVKVKTTKQSNGAWTMTEQAEGSPGPLPETNREESYDAPKDTSWFDETSSYKIVFEFENKGRNLHLNPHHMDMQVLGASFDPVNKACN
jgi:hypothetical protein